MDRAKICVFKERDEVGLDGLLEGTNGGGLEAKIRLEVLGNLTNKTLEWKLADEKLGGLLVTTDLTESDGTRLITMGLLDTTGRWGRLASGLGGELLARGFATRRLAWVLSVMCCDAMDDDVDKGCSNNASDASVGQGRTYGLFAWCGPWLRLKMDVDVELGCGW